MLGVPLRRGFLLSSSSLQITPRYCTNTPSEPRRVRQPTRFSFRCSFFGQGRLGQWPQFDARPTCSATLRRVTKFRPSPAARRMSRVLARFQAKTGYLPAKGGQ